MPSYEAELSIVDQMMPNSQTMMWWVFKTDDPETSLANFQRGLDRTVEQLPFLSGHLYEDTTKGNLVKCKWSDEAPRIPFQEHPGVGLPSYAELEKNGFAIHSLPFQWVPEALNANKESNLRPCFVAAFTRLEGGLVIMVGPHHMLMDGGGRSLLFTLLADNTRGVASAIKIDAKDPLTRAARLSEILASMEEKMEKPKTGVFDTKNRPSVPMDHEAPKSNRMLRFSVRKLDTIRAALVEHTKQPFSLNTMVSAVLWLEVSLARKNRLLSEHVDMAGRYSEMCLAINPRKWFEKDGFIERNTWVGNLATAVNPWPKVSFDSLEDTTFDLRVKNTLIDGHGLSNVNGQDHTTVPCPKALPGIIDMLTDSLTTFSVDMAVSAFTGATQAAASPGFDYSVLRNSDRFNNGMDFVVTNWGALDLLPDFGPGLGRPACARMARKPFFEGIGLMLPRHRTADAGAERLDLFESILQFRDDDMHVVEQSPLLKYAYASEPL